MILTLSETKTKKYLLVSLAASAFGIIVTNLIEKELTILFTNIIITSTAATVLIFSIIMSIRSGVTGSHGKAWIFFTIFIALWFVAETIWLVDEIIYQQEPFPSEADFFWLPGYAFYLVFSVFYIKPVKKAISKKIILFATLVSITILIPTIYFAILSDSEISQFEFVIASSYPIMDSVSLIPSLIGVILFFKGKVNFLLSLLFLGMLCSALTDIGFLFLQLHDSYYTGHPVDILYVWYYLLFLFGILHHINLFKSRDKETMFHDQESLR